MPALTRCLGAAALAVVFWGWLWGITGALIAVPIVFSMQAVFENLDATRPLAKLMQR